jgi:CheY-like chemotaxis protein
MREAEILKQEPCDVLLADIGMPSQDGYFLIEGIRSHPDMQVRTLRAIAVTSYAGDHYRAKAIAAGYDQYLTKPVAPEALELVISDLLRRKI